MLRVASARSLRLGHVSVLHVTLPQTTWIICYYKPREAFSMGKFVQNFAHDLAVTFPLICDLTVGLWVDFESPGTPYVHGSHF